MSEYGFVLFHTTSAALRAEKISKEARIESKLVPTPREYSSDCGIALRFPKESEQDIRRMLKQRNVETAEIVVPQQT